MRCPYCDGSNTRVLDTRDAQGAIRRRRVCQDCSQRFTTYERAVLDAPLVVKRDGRRQEWDFDKLLAGLRTACVKRPISPEAVERLAREVEAEVIGLGLQEVESKEVGRRLLEKLRTLDEVAYLRFASVYLPLADLECLRWELNQLVAEDQVRRVV